LKKEHFVPRKRRITYWCDFHQKQVPQREKCKKCDPRNCFYLVKLSRKYQRSKKSTRHHCGKRNKKPNENKFCVLGGKMQFRIGHWERYQRRAYKQKLRIDIRF